MHVEMLKEKGKKLARAGTYEVSSGWRFPTHKSNRTKELDDLTLEFRGQEGAKEQGWAFHHSLFMVELYKNSSMALFKSLRAVMNYEK